MTHAARHWQPIVVGESFASGDTLKTPCTIVVDRIIGHPVYGRVVIREPNGEVRTVRCNYLLARWRRLPPGSPERTD